MHFACNSTCDYSDHSQPEKKKHFILINHIHKHELQSLKHFPKQCAPNLQSRATGKLPFKDTASQEKKLI